MSVAQQPTAAAHRPLRLRMRADLDCRPQRYGNRRYWVVKDPVSLKYFHLRDEEYTVLTMLDGRVNLDELRRRFEVAFAPRRLSEHELHDFLATLHRSGLLLSESTGQGEQLLARRHDENRRRRYRSLLSVLAIRFPGVNPSRFLDWLYPKCRWLFSGVFAMAGCLLAVVAVTLVAVQFDAFAARLPDVHAIVGASNLPLLLLALAVVKILHELGHALACRHFGSDCHEIGVMLLVFTPCLYCNVSDSWLLPGKWQRIAISAAGIYVELILAAACTLLWWYSGPGILNALCLNTMLICSIGTIVLNGNPLLRYDGYFILSDLVEVPNLAAQSTAAARRLLVRWCLGLDLGGAGHDSARRQALLVSYAIASTVYRWVVVLAILWALHFIARPYGLQPLVVILACVTIGAMAGPAVAGAVRLARDPGRSRRFALARVGLTAVLIVAAVLAMLLVPLPMRVSAPLMVEYEGAQRVYVTVPGTLVKSAKVGQQVERGQLLAQLANPRVEREVARLTSDRDRQQSFLANLEAQRLQGALDGTQIPAAKAALADIQERLAQLEQDAARLSIVAPARGEVLPPPARPHDATAADKLSGWSGTPLDERNVGCYLETGTLVCLVGDPDRFEAVLHVAHTDVELVQPGQPVRMVLDSLPGQVFWGRVVEIGKLDLKVMPRELAASGDVPARTDERGVSRPLDTWYQARVRFDEMPRHLVARVHGTARISVAPQSLGSQLARYLEQTFSR